MIRRPFMDGGARRSFCLWRLLPLRVVARWDPPSRPHRAGR